MFDTRRILYGINEKEYINSFGYEMMIRKALKEYSVNQIPDLSLAEIKRLLSLCAQE